MNDRAGATATKDVLSFSQMKVVLKKIGAQDPRWAGNAVAEIDAAQESIRASDDGTGALIAETGTEELSRIALGKYALRERYARNVEQLDRHAAEFTDWMVKTYRDMVLAYSSDRFNAIRADIESGYEWDTGLRDAGRQVADLWNRYERWLTRPEGKPDHRPPPAHRVTFLEEIVARHFTEDLFRRFCEKTEADLSVALTEKWKAVFFRLESDLDLSMRQLVLREDIPGFSRMETGWNAGSATAVIGLGAAMTSTVVLAAGWHTLSWAIGGLFLPLLPVVMLASVGVAVWRKDVEKQKLIDSVTSQQKRFEQSISDTIEYRTRAAFAAANQETVRKARRLSFEKVVGRFDAALLDEYIRALEDTLDELVHANRTGPDREQIDRGWLARAEKALADGDDLAAAMYGSLSFEQLLHDLNRKYAMNFNFRVPHHNRAFIDVLARNERATPQIVSALRGLKTKRDLFTHRMHQVAAINEGRRTRMIRKFLEELREMEK